MRVTDRLIRDNQKKQQRRKAISAEEDTLTYMQRKRQTSLNREPGVFESKFQGINTEKSVFDRTAVFQVGKVRDRQDADKG